MGLAWWFDDTWPTVFACTPRQSQTCWYLLSYVVLQCQDLVLSQKAEESKQMKQDLQRAQSLFTSAERELRYEKEKNMDLKRHNTLLDQEKLKVAI